MDVESKLLEIDQRLVELDKRWRPSPPPRKTSGTVFPKSAPS